MKVRTLSRLLAAIPDDADISIRGIDGITAHFQAVLATEGEKDEITDVCIFAIEEEI